MSQEESLNKQITENSETSVDESKLENKIEMLNISEDGLRLLETSWTFWSFQKSEKSFEDSLIQIGSFNTVEGFWGYEMAIKNGYIIFN